MKKLKLLNKKYLIIILILIIFGFSTHSEEPADIWNVKENNIKIDENIDVNLEKKKNCRK